MRLIRLVSLCVLLAVVSVVPTQGKAWRDIVPLRSTRADVERLLGPPETGTRNVYKTEGERISVTYAEEECAYGWRVPFDTVISLTVHPQNPPRLSEVKLDESKYDKRQDNHLEAVYYYVNIDEGINYTVDVGKGAATAIEYFPAARDTNLRCSVTNLTSGIKHPSQVNQPVVSPGEQRKKPEVIPRTFVCPMHPNVISRKSGTCPRCGMRLLARRNRSNARKRAAPKNNSKQASQNTQWKLPEGATAVTTSQPVVPLSAAERVRALEQLAPTYELTCVMHPEIRHAEEGVCPKCGMPLVAVTPTVRGQYVFELASIPPKPQPGEKVQLRFVISTPNTAERVKNYVVNHEKLFHLFIVSQDMSEYQHIHPQLQPDGSFTVSTAFPRAGLYKLHADFFPVGGTAQVIHRELLTAGIADAISPVLPVLTPDAALTKSLDGMTITLNVDRAGLKAGTLVSLKYHLTDARTGEPVRDLEPYLGAWGHTLILNADQSEYLHSHPSEMVREAPDRTMLRGGPVVDFKTMFPTVGPYRIWTQFQRFGKITTVSFTVRVPS